MKKHYVVNLEYDDHGNLYPLIVILTTKFNLQNDKLIYQWLRYNYKMGFIRCDDKSNSFGDCWNSVPPKTFGLKQPTNNPNKFFWNWQHLTAIEIKKVTLISEEEYIFLKKFAKEQVITKKGGK